MENSEITENQISSETIDFQSNNSLVDISRYQQPSPYRALLFLRILAYLFFVITIALSITIFVLPSNVQLLIVLVVSISLFIFLVFVNQELHRNYTKKLSDYNILKATDMYINVAQLEGSPKITQIAQGVELALNYTQRLIEENENTRRQTKYLYYILQIITIIFSAVTPIVVLIEKSNPNPSWLKWLPVILPAIASIIASLSTSFPFEDTWLSSRKALESLEAEKEKFLLGVSPGYRIPRYAEEKERYKMTRDAMAKFINQVSSIHLKQLKDNEAIEKQVEEGKKE